MHSARPGPRRRAPLLAGALALCAASLAGCSRDLAVPSVPTGPVLVGAPPFAPQAAYAGELIRVTASHLETDATANTVNFALASARGEGWDGGALLVRVPAGAGDGPITVSNREATSDASGVPFAYRGLGEPGRRQVASRSPILQHPRAVYPVGGDVLLESGLYGGLVWAGSAPFTTPPTDLSAADVDSGDLYFVSTNLLFGTRLFAVDAAKGLVLATTFLPDVPHQILPLRGTGLVLTFHTSDVDGEVVRGWDAATLAQVFDATPFGIGSFDGAADVGDGRAVVAGYDPGFDRFTLFLLDLKGAPTPPANATEFDCAPGYLGACPPELGTNSRSRVPLAVAPSGFAGPYAAAALASGNAVVATLAGTPQFVFDVETFSPVAIESMAGGEYATAVVATKPEAGYAVAFDVASGSLRWLVDANVPTAVATLPQPSAGGSTDLAFVAGDADNDVLIVNMGTGLKVGRVNFDVSPRGQRYADAAAFVASATGLDGDVVFPTASFPGLLRFPLGAGAPTAITRAPDIDAVVASPDSRALWIVTSGATPYVDGYLGYVDGSWTSSVSAELASVPQRLAAHGSLAAIGHFLGLSLVDGLAPPPGPAPTAEIPGATAGPPVFDALGFTPTGDLWAVVEVDDGPVLQLWPTGAIVPGGAPSHVEPLAGTPHSAAWLEEGLWIFSIDPLGTPVATLFDDQLAPVRTVQTSPRLTEVHAISPNRRLLVHRELSAEGWVLRFFRADPDTGFPEVGNLLFTERIEGFAFDATGERLFVPTQNPDRIVTVD